MIVTPKGRPVKRQLTRLPYPFASQVRFLTVGLVYRLLGLLLAPAVRRRITLDELATARVLVLKPCCLGDVVFATPLLRELRRALPGAHLTLGVGSHARPAIANNPAVDAVLDTGAVGSGKFGFWQLFALVRQVRQGRFDACLVLERSALLALVPALAGVPRRVGIESGGRGFSLGVAVPAGPARPESELYLDLLRALGGRPESGDLEYHPSGDAVRRIDQILNEWGDSREACPFVVLHCAGGTNPGMALTRKRWPEAGFRALAERILHAGARVVFVGAPEDRGVTRSVLAELLAGTAESDRAILDLVGQLTLDELAELSRRAAVYVGNDTGPTHLAEAAGANVVMLFGPSDPIVYGPRRRGAVALTAGLWCSPCFENGRVAPCANVICLRSIPVERVWREMAGFLGVEVER